MDKTTLGVGATLGAAALAAVLALTGAGGATTKAQVFQQVSSDHFRSANASPFATFDKDGNTLTAGVGFDAQFCVPSVIPDVDPVCAVVHGTLSPDVAKSFIEDMRGQWATQQKVDAAAAK